MKLYELIETEDIKPIAPEQDAHMEFYANAKNWPVDVEGAKEFAYEALGQLVHRGKVPRFINQIAKMTRIQDIQQIILNIILSGEGMHRIK